SPDRPHPPTTPAETLDPGDGAPPVAAQLGDKYRAAGADGMRGVTAARAGEWRIALQSFVREATHRVGVDETLLMPEAAQGAAIALAQLGDLEDAAVIRGFAEANFALIREPLGQDWWTETHELLRNGLADAELARLTARGASLSTRDAITLMRDAAESL